MGGELPAVDWIAAAILAVAALRGLFVGLIRKLVSIASLVAACLVVARFTPDAAAWLLRSAGAAVAPALAPWIAGALLAIGTVTAGALLGRLLRRGAQLAWLGLPDRVGGALIGAAEGVLLCAILLRLGTAWIGREHPLVEHSFSIAALERLERFAARVGPAGIDVAAPPPRQR